MEAQKKQRFFQLGLSFVSATASVACFRTGFLVFLFLFPLAMAVFLGERKTAWLAGILAVVLNSVVSIWFYTYRSEDLIILQWNGIYYLAMVLVFIWVNVPLGNFFILREIPYRMAAGAAFCCLIFIPVFLSMIYNPNMRSIIINQLETLGSVSSADFSTPVAEELVSGMVYIGLRGGILFFCLFFWWLNRQFGLLLCRLLRRDRTSSAGIILAFRTPFFFIWILSFSLGAIVLGKIAHIELLEICGWNFLVLSATLFLVQGGSVLLYFLARLPPLPRIIINIGIVYLFFKPGINAVILGLLILLGIAENWVPFRAPKQ